MDRRRPLSDAWLVWDAERLEGYPHSDGPAARLDESAPAGQHGRARKPLGQRLLHDVLLYGAGVASALFGVGLALLLGSFISAYSVLTEVSRVENRSIVEYPAANFDQLAVLSDAAAEGQKTAQTDRGPARDVRPAENAVKLSDEVGRKGSSRL